MCRRMLLPALILLSSILCGSISATTRSWSGASSTNWSEAANWVPAGVPTAGDDLVFPAGTSNMNNDLPPGFVAGSLTFDTGFSKTDVVTLGGNPFTLAGDLRFLGFGPQFLCNSDLRIGAPLHLGVAWGSEYRGVVDVNGQTLTVDSGNLFRGAITGTGAIVVTGGNIVIAGNGDFAGSIEGSVNLIGSMPNMNKIGSGFLFGNGTIGSVAVEGKYSGVMPGANSSSMSDPHDVGLIDTKALSVSGGFYADLYPDAASDAVHVTGPVSLGGVLHARIGALVHSPGTSFTIIDNDGPAPVAGAFSTAAGGPILPEGGIFTNGIYQLRLSYRGGDGNDVVLYVLSDTTTAISQDSAASYFGDPVTIMATVDSRAGSVQGVVTFFDNGLTFGSAPIQNGVATLTTSALAEGGHNLSVSYPGNNTFGPSSPRLLIIHQVQPARVAVAFPIAGVSQAEGDSGTRVVSIPVVLAAKSQQTVTVRYQSQDGTARTGADYLGVQGTLTFAPGETEKVIDVTILGDTEVESDETFNLILADPANATIGGSPVTVTILNDDHPSRGVTYGFASTGGTRLTLEVNTPVTGNGPYPAIVWVGATAMYAPGGDSPALRETARGYVVVIPNYRSAVAAPFPAQLEDLKAAVRWLRANAALINIDPQHIGIWGGGAGAHLAALVGTTGGVFPLDGQSPANPAFSSRVQAVVDWAGPADLLRLQSDAPVSCVPSYDDASSPQSLLIGCPLQTCADAANAASPQTFVSSDDAPILIMHGAADCAVSPEQSRRFYQSLKTAGVDATLRIVTGLGAFDATWDSSTSHPDVDAFLDLHLKPQPSRRRGVAH